MDVDSAVLHLVEQSQDLEDGGDMAGAFVKARSALQQASQPGASKFALAHAMVRLGKLQFRVGDYSEAVRLARETLEMSAEEWLACAQAWLLLGNCAAETDSLAEAEGHFQQVIDLSNKYGFPLLRYRALHSLSAGVYVPRGQFDLALDADREALNILEKAGAREDLWRPLFTIAHIYWQTGRADQVRGALRTLCSEVSPESPGAAHYLCLQALLAMDDADDEAALAYFSRAKDASDALGDPGIRVFVRLGLSCFNRQLGDLPMAWDWANDALFIANRTGYQHFHGVSLIERGRAAWGNEDLAAAEADFAAARRLLGQIEARYDLARVNLLLAALLHQAGREGVEQAWLEAARGMIGGGYAFLAFKEQDLVFPLLERFLESGDSEISRASSRLVSLLQALPPEPLQVTTLGDFRVWKGRRLVDKRALRQRRAGELLALLLQSPARSLLFEQISECLWPGRDPALTRTLFHHACASLRKALEPGLPERLASRYLAVEEGRVALLLPPSSEVDYEVFEDLVRRGEWAAAVSVYRGEYLPDFLYADWTQALRQRLELLAQNAMFLLAQRLVEQGDHRDALEVCSRLLILEPWHEGATLLGMQACCSLDDHVGAIRLYKMLEKALQSELGVSPSAELQNLYRTLTARHLP